MLENLFQRLSASLFARTLVRLELAVACVLLAAAAVIAPYYMFEWPGSGRAGTLLLLCAGLVLAAVAIGPGGHYLRRMLDRATDKLTLRAILVLGLVLQVVTALATAPVPVSDGKMYLSLAAMLSEGRYADNLGQIAFWPPGLPLVLSPLVALLGAGMLSVVIANLLFYAIGAVSAWRLGSDMFDRRSGLLAAFLFTVWPSRFLSAAVVSKENLTIAMMLAGASLTVLAFRRNDGKWWLPAAAAGAAFGLAAMAQPGLLLFVLMIPLAYRLFLATGARFVAVSGVVFLVGILTLMPWHLRNCYVFNGEFCGLATNGGSVFYRANNPLATGEWTPEGKIPITHLPELEQNRLGFALGKQWITENPQQFAMLAARKLGLLLRDDRYGAYWGILRAEGGTHSEAVRDASPGRNLAYKIGHWVSLAFWILICCWSARALIGILLSRDRVQAERALVFVYPLLYSAAVFSVFESDRRQHLMALGFLIVFAAGALHLGKPVASSDRSTA